MRILGHNLMPYNVLQLTNGWASSQANGIIAHVFFFDSDFSAQGDFSQHLNDMRNLFNNAAAVTRIILRPTQEGLLPLADQQVGWKARSGSVYEIKNGATVHYPEKCLPVGIGVASNTLITTSYATSLDAGNKALWGVGPGGYEPYRFPGFPHDASDPMVSFGVTDLEFSQAVTINAVLSDVATKSQACAGTIVALNDAGTATVGSTVSWSLLADQEGNVLPSSVGPAKKFRFVHTSGSRRVVPVTASDVSAVVAPKTLKWALVVIQDTNYGALANGSYVPTYFACEVGAINSGKPIELLSTTLAAGEFASVAQVRTSTEV